MNHSEYFPVTAAVIEKDGKILIARKRSLFAKESWEFPGGKLEYNETLEECLKREIREELAIEIEVGDFVCSNKHIIDCSKAITLYAYRARYVSGTIALTDHEETRWVLPEDLMKYDYPDPDRMIAKEVVNIFKNS